MATFKIAVTMSQIQTFTKVVTVDAEDAAEAEQIAYEMAQEDEIEFNLAEPDTSEVDDYTTELKS